MSSLLPRFLQDAIIKIARLEKPQDAELEIRTRVPELKTFLQIIDTVKELSSDISFLQRRDILYKGFGPNEQCRTTFVGPKKGAHEFMFKTEIHKVAETDSLPRNYVLASETILVAQTSIPDARQAVFLKTRCLVHMPHWRVELVASHQLGSLSDQEILAKQAIYFGRPIASLADFTAYVSNRVFIFQSFQVEYELTAPLTQDSIPPICDEFMQIDRVLFNEDKQAIKFRTILHKAVALYRADHGNKINTIKRATKQVVTLTTHLLLKHFPFSHWYVTDKSDGVHALFYLPPGNVAYLLDQTLTELPTTAASDSSFIFDGEIITMGDKRHFMVFDIIIFDDLPVHSMNFQERQTYFARATALVNGYMATIAKDFSRLPDRNVEQAAYEQTLDAAVALALARPYGTDGLIFISPEADYQATTIMKWKPASHTTIDCLAKIVPNNVLGTSVYQQKAGLTLYVLYVSIGAAERMRFESYHITSLQFTQTNFRNNYPIPFQTSLASNMYLYYDREATLDGEVLELLPIWKDLQGLECQHSATSILGWKRLKVRDDKRIDTIDGDYFGNYWLHAEETLMNFLNPITIDNLKGVQNERYFIEARDDMYKAPTSFNNTIKRVLFDTHVSGSAYLLDLAGGRGSDINNYVERGAKKIFIIERDISAIQELVKRKHEIFGRPRSTPLPTMLILHQDLTAPPHLILTRMQLLGAPAPPIDNNKRSAAIQLGFDVVTCFFAIHYLVTNDGALKNFVNLVSSSLKSGGKFIFTTFNPDRVLELMAAHNNCWSIIENGRRKYYIKLSNTAEYQPLIKVQLPFTRGLEIEEHLINKRALLDMFAAAKFQLVDMFDFSEKFLDSSNSYMKHYNSLSAADRQFIGLNMCCVLKRT